LGFGRLWVRHFSQSEAEAEAEAASITMSGETFTRWAMGAIRRAKVGRLTSEKAAAEVAPLVVPAAAPGCPMTSPSPLTATREAHERWRRYEDRIDAGEFGSFSEFEVMDHETYQSLLADSVGNLLAFAEAVAELTKAVENRRGPGTASSMPPTLAVAELRALLDRLVEG
jgi:hypothetical protein